MIDADRFLLLFGPYKPPTLSRGDRATCLFLETTVTITSRTDCSPFLALCRPFDNFNGRPTILLDEELARVTRDDLALLGPIPD